MNINTFCNQADSVAALMKSLANPYRLMIVCRLREGECSVGALGERLDLQQSALSQHLARLRADGLVKTRREAQTIFYSLADRRIGALMQTLYTLYCGPNGRRTK